MDFLAPAAARVAPMRRRTANRRQQQTAGIVADKVLDPAHRAFNKISECGWADIDQASSIKPGLRVVP